MPGNGWKWSRLWLVAGLFASLGLGRLGQAFHVGAWLDTLPFTMQVLAKAALVLLATVVPFAVWVAVAGRRAAAERRAGRI
jgi:hypothetical protein